MFMTVTPFLTGDLEVNSYQLLSQNISSSMVSTQTAFSLDGALRPPSFEYINKIGLSALTNDLPLFIPIMAVTLSSDIEHQLSADPRKIVFLLDGDFLANTATMTRIAQLEKLGYKFALKNPRDYVASAPLIAIMDYVIISDNKDFDNAKKVYVRFNHPDVKIIVSHISENERFEDLKQRKYALYEGRFYRVPITKGTVEISPLKMNYIQLLDIANDENFNISEVSDIVSTDIALSVSLLNMVNSLNLVSEITSIRHAAAILGQRELRKWITTAVISFLCTEKPDDLIRLSLIRAKFAEKLAPAFEMAIHAQELFMLGLFSVLDLALQLPMAEALKIIKLPPNVEAALLTQNSKYNQVLDYIKIYEDANWQEIFRLSIVHKMDCELINQYHFEAMQWYATLFSSIDKHAS